MILRFSVALLSCFYLLTTPLVKAQKVSSQISSRQVVTKERDIISGSNLTQVATSRHHFETNIPAGALSKAQAESLIEEAFGSGFTTSVINLIDSGGVRFSVTGLYPFAEGATISVDRAYLNANSTGTTGVLRADQAYIGRVDSTNVVAGSLSINTPAFLSTLSAQSLHVAGEIDTPLMSADHVSSTSLDAPLVRPIDGSGIVIYDGEDPRHQYDSAVIIDGGFISSGSVEVDGSVRRISSDGVGAYRLFGAGRPLGNELGYFRLDGSSLRPVVVADVLAVSGNEITFIKDERPVYFEWWPDRPPAGLVVEVGGGTLNRDLSWDTQEGDAFSFVADASGYLIMRPGHPTDGLQEAGFIEVPDVRYLGTNGVVDGVYPKTNAVFQASFVGSSLGEPYMIPYQGTLWTRQDLPLVAMISGFTQADEAFIDGWNDPYTATLRTDILYPNGSLLSDVGFFEHAQPVLNYKNPADVSLDGVQTTPRYYRTSPTTGYIEHDVIVGQLVVFQMRGALGMTSTMSLLPTEDFFIPTDHLVTTEASPREAGTTEGGGVYTYGDFCSVGASAGQGFLFRSWSTNGHHASFTTPFIFPVYTNTVCTAYFTNAMFFVDTETSTPEGGTTFGGGGYYKHSSKVTIVASPNDGYGFVGWQEGTNFVSSSVSYSFSVVRDTLLTAVFAPLDRNVTGISVPPEGGSVVGVGGFAYGASCRAVAVANEGYSFLRWEEKGSTVASTTNYTFTVYENSVVYAVFVPDVFVVSLEASPAEGGVLTGGGDHAYGSTASIKAKAQEGYDFVEWVDDGGIVTSHPTHTFTVAGDKSFTARFSTTNYMVDASASPSQGGIVFGQGRYAPYTTQSLSAIPVGNHEFVAWYEGDTWVSDDPTISFVVYSAREFTALFKPKKVYVYVTAGGEGNGRVVGGGNYVEGETISLSATPAPGSVFVKWTKDGDSLSTESELSFVVPGACSLVAFFAPIDCEVTTRSKQLHGGTTFGDGWYTYGETCTIQAEATNGYVFVNWVESGEEVSTSASHTFSVGGSWEFIASFLKKMYSILVSYSEGGFAYGGGTKEYGSTANLVAYNNPGCVFLSWEEGGYPVSTNQFYSFDVLQNRDLHALFAVSYTVAALASPTNAGTISGVGRYPKGGECVLEAVPGLDHQFTHWETEGGHIVSHDNPYAFEVVSNTMLRAVFGLKDYRVDTFPERGYEGSTFGDGYRNYAEDITVDTIDGPGYEFRDWSVVTNAVSGGMSMTLTNSVPSHIITNLLPYVSWVPGGWYQDPITGTWIEAPTIPITNTHPYLVQGYTNEVVSVVVKEVVSTNRMYTFPVVTNTSLVAGYELKHPLRAAADTHLPIFTVPEGLYGNQWVAFNNKENPTIDDRDPLGFDSHDGRDMLVTQNIDGNVHSATLYLDIMEPGTLSWYMKAIHTYRGERYPLNNTLRFYVGFTAPLFETRSPEWQRYSVHLSAGLNTLRWVYTRDNRLVGVTSVGAIDEITWEPDEQGGDNEQ